MKKLIFGGVVALALLSACSPFTLINSEVYNNADLNAYNTYRLVSPDDGHLPPGMEMAAYYNIAAAIRQQLAMRGFTEDPNSPLLINIGLTVQKDLVTVPYTQMIPTGPALPPPPMPPLPRPGVTPPPAPGQLPPPGPAQNGVIPYFIYPRAYYWPNYTTVTQWVPTIYREGVLTIDFVNIKTMTPLYSASVATILNNGDSQLRNLQGINDAVKVLFSKFPVPVMQPQK